MFMLIHFVTIFSAILLKDFIFINIFVFNIRLFKIWFSKLLPGAPLFFKDMKFCADTKMTVKPCKSHH